jgi:hypothetical protein
MNLKKSSILWVPIGAYGRNLINLGHLPKKKSFVDIFGLFFSFGKMVKIHHKQTSSILMNNTTYFLIYK